jgi:hypothetical protein
MSGDNITNPIVDAQHIPKRTRVDIQRDLGFAQTQMQEYWHLYTHWRDTFKNTLTELENHDVK